MAERKKGLFKTRLTLDVSEAQEYDYILLNNPVFVRGYAMCAAVGGAVSLKSAVLLAIAGSLLIIPVRLLGDLTVGIVKAKLRIAAYAVLSGLFCVPVMVFMTWLFGGDTLVLGVYMPLVFLDSVVLSRAVQPAREGPRLVWSGAFGSALGYSLALVLIGTIRELLAAGTLWEAKVLPAGIWSAAAGIPCGLIITALLCAVWQAVCAVAKRVKFIGGHDNE